MELAPIETHSTISFEFTCGCIFTPDTRILNLCYYHSEQDFPDMNTILVQAEKPKKTGKRAYFY